MKFYCVVWLLLAVNVVFGNKSAKFRHRPTFLTISTETRRDITIPIVVHLDFKLSKKLAKEHSFKTRKKIKTIVSNVFKEANVLFRRPSLNQTITLKLLDTKFFRKTTAVAMDENATNYLRSYCQWQSLKKVKQKKLYYSVLLTGLDLFYIKNGRAVKSSTARSYANGVCSMQKSCTLIEWNPKNMGYLLAHEIGHSLGITHDGLPFNNCGGFKGIMQPKYDSSNHPQVWSPCSRVSFEYFLRSEKSWCIQNDEKRRLKYKFS
ncbi:unnamed protein product [Leptosia nina]|uniref:Peptidase M12B domain-containing protein n=1 Tax=Leptosia nina TaxID=320188 RepID=A0AAV1JN45_9NEOP